MSEIVERSSDQRAAAVRSVARAASCTSLATSSGRETKGTWLDSTWDVFAPAMR